MDRQRLDLVQVVDAVAQMRHDALAQADVNVWNGGQHTRNLVGGVREAGTEAVVLNHWVAREPLLTFQFVQVANGELEDVGLLQFGDIFALRLQRDHHQFFELVQATVDAGATLSLQHGLHHFAVLISARQRLQGSAGRLVALHDHRFLSCAVNHFGLVTFDLLFYFE